MSSADEPSTPSRWAPLTPLHPRVEPLLREQLDKRDAHGVRFREHMLRDIPNIIENGDAS